MINFEISAEVLERLGKIPLTIDKNIPEKLKNQIKNLRCEIKNNTLYIIATNQKVAAVEKIDNVNQPDSCCYLKITPDFMKYLKKNKTATVTVSFMPEIAVGTVSSEGYLDTEACEWFATNVMDSWREWANAKYKATAECMYWDMVQVQLLFDSSYSGKIVFPTNCDPNKSLVLRDSSYENWVGLFIPAPDDTESTHEPAVLPEWWKE